MFHTAKVFEARLAGTMCGSSGQPAAQLFATPHGNPNLSKPSAASHKATLRVAAALGLNADADIAAQPIPPSTPGRDPPSWPSDAARRAAFGAVQQDAAEGVAASISGQLPTWLRGVYLRNGPGTYENGSPEGMVHMFDGYGMIVKLEIKGNSVTASHRFVDSEAYKRFKSSGKQAWREFATPVPHQGWSGKAGEVAGMVLGVLRLSQGVTDNASVSILPQEDSVWAMTETVPGTLAIDPVTLRTLGRVRYADTLRGDLTTAHPTRLPNGDLINLLSMPGAGFSVYRQRYRPPESSSLPARELVASVAHHRPLSPAWIHDFPGSNRHIVIPETPMFFNLGSLMGGGDTPHIFMDWAPQERARLHVVRLADGHVHTFTAPPFFAFHWANAFESEDGRFLHIDGSVYDDPAIVNHLKLSSARAGPGEGAQLPRSGLRRLTLDLHAQDGSEVASAWEGLVEDESSHGSFIEFPCVAPARRGTAYRYAWATCAVQPTNLNNALAKVDTHQRRCVVWHEAGGVVGEPTFVPAPEAAAEDEGVLLSIVIQADGMAALVVLDGRSHEEVARALLPYALPNGFHGAFIATEGC